MRFQGYRGRRWHRRGGMVGFPFILFFMIFLFSHSIGALMFAIMAIVLLGLLARVILPAIFGAGLMNSLWSGNRQTYQQQQPYQQTYQPYQPSPESYQSYEQGYQYQPPVTPNREQEAEQQQYQAPSYEQAHYEEQPQAQYPQEMPPMHQ